MRNQQRYSHTIEYFQLNSLRLLSWMLLSTGSHSCKIKLHLSFLLQSFHSHKKGNRTVIGSAFKTTCVASSSFLEYLNIGIFSKPKCPLCILHLFDSTIGIHLLKLQNKEHICAFSMLWSHHNPKTCRTSLPSVLFAQIQEHAHVSVPCQRKTGCASATSDQRCPRNLQAL